MSKLLNLSEVRKNLPRLVDEVASEKRTVVIARRGEPIAQLGPYVEAKSECSVYPLRDMPIEIPDDFDDELPVEWKALT